MNKSVALFCAVLALLLSCSREVDHVIQPGETITFTAGWAGAEDTRTILQPNGTSVWWEPGAQINVFFGDKASGRFTSTNSQAQAIVDFTGSLPIVVGSVETENPAHTYWAVYPYDSANTCDGESVTLTIPSTQTAVEGTFANKMFPSIATSTNFYLAFYNVCGGVRFTVANEGIRSVTFSANGGESLVGKVQVGFGADGKPSINKILDGSTTVTVNAPEGGFVPGVYYFAAFLPGVLSKGLSMTFFRSTSSATYALENTVTINRSRFGTLENKDSDLDFGGIVEVSSISFDQSLVLVRKGEVIKLVATVLPEDAVDKTVEWKSSDATVATVDQYGNVTGIKEGRVSITASAGGKSSTCTVSVIPADFQPNSEYLSFTALENSTLIYSSEGYSIDVEISYDKNSWQNWESNYAISLNSGSTVYVRAKDWKSRPFIVKGRVAASGNVMSLLYYDDYYDKYTIPYANAFQDLFLNCDGLVKAPALPATTLSSSCYRSMFQDCINLTQAPDLPATTLAGNCYFAMFSGCTGLAEAPELPAMDLKDLCYYEMFSNCTGLQHAPELPAMNLARSCYNTMFYNCSSLTKAPDLPATTLAKNCYSNMFLACTSLTKAPAICATKLEERCCSRMFWKCTSLTKAPDLPAKTLAEHCYDSMFANCTSLTQAQTILPATTLAPGCYDSMFQGCTSLTTAPVLPALSIPYQSCYSNMFGGCESLSYVKMMGISFFDSTIFFCWMDGTAKNGTFVKHAAATWDENGIVPSDWTVITATE